ncbi:MAG: DUF2807 domain-containing protein [Zetaproteobacteria bacterium]|nr:DUF2807 domain-containing protein [Zetaproteobacteria bacterium]
MRGTKRFVMVIFTLATLISSLGLAMHSELSVSIAGGCSEDCTSRFHFLGVSRLVARNLRAHVEFEQGRQDEILVIVETCDETTGQVYVEDMGSFVELGSRNDSGSGVSLPTTCGGRSPSVSSESLESMGGSPIFLGDVEIWNESDVDHCSLDSSCALTDTASVQLPKVKVFVPPSVVMELEGVGGTWQMCSLSGGLFKADLSGSCEMHASQIVGNCNITCSGSSRCNVVKVREGDLDVKLSGASSLSLNGLESIQVTKLSLSGSSEATLGAACWTTHLDAVTDGSSSLIFNGDAASASLHASGSSNLYVANVHESLDEHASGCGQITVSEKPSGCGHVR